MIHNEELSKIKSGEGNLDMAKAKRTIMQSHEDRKRDRQGGGGRGRGGKNSKIDYKAKAIAGKQAGIDRQIAGATAEQGPNS